MPTARRKRTRMSAAPQMIQPPARRVTLESKGPGDWYVVHKQVERNGRAYLPVTHHLVQSGSVPAEVPSCGAKPATIGGKTVPVDVTGLINLEDAEPKEVFELIQAGAVRPVDPVRSQKRIEEGRRAAKTSAPQMIPPMKRVTSQGQQYEQATGVQMTSEGAQHLAFAQATLPSPFVR